MSILYNNAGTAELYNRNPDIALIRYKEGLDYARANNRPAQRIGLMKYCESCLIQIGRASCRERV